jgi:hypothetical protein
MGLFLLPQLVRRRLDDAKFGSANWSRWVIEYWGNNLGIRAIAGLILLQRRQTFWLCSVQFLGFLAFLMFVIMPASEIVDTERQLPLRQIAQAVVQVEKPGEEVVMIANGFEKPTLVFYSKRPVTFLMRPTDTIPHIQNTAKQSPSKSILLIATEQALQKTGLQINQYQAISQAGIYELVRVLKTRVIE